MQFGAWLVRGFWEINIPGVLLKSNFGPLLLLKDDMCNKFEKEILYLKQNIYSDKKEIEIQTDVDSKVYGDILKNNDLVVFHKKLVKEI